MKKIKCLPKSHTPGGTQYALDDEGYIKVEFRSSDGSVVDMNRLSEMMAKMSLGKSEPSFVKAIPPQYIKAADQGKITQEMLLGMDYTDLIRLAAYPPASKKIWELLKIRGVPLRWGVKETMNDAGVSTLEVLPEAELYRLQPHQAKAIAWMKGREDLSLLPAATNKAYGLKGGILSLKMGLGKCHAKDTKILMWNGTIKAVQNVKIGDLLCGDDSTPREVLSLARGREQMYEITPTKGDSYVVNESHILTLCASGNKSVYWNTSCKQYQISWFDHNARMFRCKLVGKNLEVAEQKVAKIVSSDIIDIPLIEYLALSKTTQSRLKGVRTGVEWPAAKVLLDPYILGLWLGDGTETDALITNVDEEVTNSIYDWAGKLGYSVNPRKHDAITYSITGGFRVVLKEIGVFGNKHVPLMYKRNSMEVRLAVLAGLLDTDGSSYGGCYDIIQKRKVLAEDICYLARSCGFAAYMKECTKTCTNAPGGPKTGTYYRVTISGDLHRIPVRITRKKLSPRLQKKNVLVSNITVKALGEDEYYGFTLDGNSRYLLGDFTITHNTLVAIVLSLVSAKGDFPTLVVASKTVMHEWKTEGVEKFLGGNIKVLYLHQDFMGGKKNFDKVTRQQIKGYDLVITTYDACVQACRKGSYQEEGFEMGDDHTMMKGKIAAVHLRTKQQADLPKVIGGEVIYGTPWERVICDESQRYANPKTMTYKCIMAIYGKYKWCLTGTPIRNYDTDIWAQLRFCGYNGVTQTIEWKRYGNTKFREHHLVDAIFTMTYKDANVVLPPKTENEVLIRLKGKQKQAYEYILGSTKEMYDKMMNNLCSFACVLAMFTRLRQCAIAPYLLTAESKREKLKGAQAKADKEAVELLKKMTAGGIGKWCHEKEGEAGIYSAKMTEIVDNIARIPAGEKVLIFSMFTSCLDLLADALRTRLPDFHFVQVDGDTKGMERADLLKQFRTNPDTRGLMLTYKVGSEGLNLTEATHCICIEPWWTSAVPNQAKARLYRKGQKKPVFIHNILVQDTIEEKVVAICKEKEEMAASFLDGTEKPLGKKVGLDKFTLGRILGIR